jgi:hypothetical protein
MSKIRNRSLRVCCHSLTGRTSVRFLSVLPRLRGESSYSPLAARLSPPIGLLRVTAWTMLPTDEWHK